MMDADGAAPLACAPGAIPADERAAHFALAAELFGGAVQERRGLEDGYAFRFVPERLDGVMRFVANERRCCPFLEFTITVAPSGGPVWLRMAGPAGTRASWRRSCGSDREATCASGGRKAPYGACTPLTRRRGTMSRIRIDLDQLGVALSDHDSEWVLDSQTGDLLIADWLRDSEWREMGIEAGGEDYGDDPLEGDRFIEIEFIGSNQGFRWMEDFALGQENEHVREKLLEALDRPRPFRQFKDALHAFPEVREAWHRYEDDRLKECARAWLASHDIDADVLEAAPPGTA